MDWLSWIRDLIPFGARATVVRKTLVKLHKINVVELEECKPKGFIRERPWWRMEKIDFYHLQPDGAIKHTRGD